MKVTFNGWQIVTLVGMVLAAIVVLVAMGQELSALITTGLLVASALGVPIVQGFVNSEKMGQLKEQGNGTLTAKDKIIADLQAQLGLQSQEYMRQMAEAHNRATVLATLVPPDTKIPDGLLNQENSNG